MNKGMRWYRKRIINHHEHIGGSRCTDGALENTLILDKLESWASRIFTGLASGSQGAFNLDQRTRRSKPPQPLQTAEWIDQIGCKNEPRTLKAKVQPTHTCLPRSRSQILRTATMIVDNQFVRRLLARVLECLDLLLGLFFLLCRIALAPCRRALHACRQCGRGRRRSVRPTVVEPDL